MSISLFRINAGNRHPQRRGQRKQSERLDGTALPCLAIESPTTSGVLGSRGFGIRSGLSTGGERGIRTPDTRKGIHAFEARAFSHSAISPRRQFHFILSGKLLARIFPAPLTERSPAQFLQPSPGCGL